MINYGGHRCATLLRELSGRHVIRAVHSCPENGSIIVARKVWSCNKWKREVGVREGEGLGRLLGPEVTLKASNTRHVSVSHWLAAQHKSVELFYLHNTPCDNAKDRHTFTSLFVPRLYLNPSKSVIVCRSMSAYNNYKVKHSDSLIQ